MKKILFLLLEILSDLFIYIFAIIPLSASLFVDSTCQRFDEAVGAENCILSISSSIGNAVLEYMFIFAFGGFLFILPILLGASIFTIYIKIKRYIRYDSKYKNIRLFYSAPAILVLLLFFTLLLSMSGIFK